MNEEEQMQALKEAKRVLTNNIDLIYRENAAFLSETQVESSIYKDWYMNRIYPIEQKIDNLDKKIKELENSSNKE